MARRVYKHCKTCNQIILVYGEQRKGDKLCPHLRGRDRTGIEPTVYYVNKAGARLYPWDGRKLPQKYTDLGYQRVELNGLGDVRRFERETNRQLQADQERERENESMVNEYKRDQRHADLRNDMAQMDDFHRELAHEAMRDESRGYSERYDPNFRIGAYE